MGGCENRGHIIALSPPEGRELWRRETLYISTATGLVIGSVPVVIPLLSTEAMVALAFVLATVGVIRAAG